MTTLVGIRANDGIEGVVLASDYLRGDYEGEIMVSKRSVRKLYWGDFWMMGDAGGDHKDVIKFYHYLKGHRNYGSDENKARSMIQEAVRKKDFERVNQVNKIISKKGSENTHSFIFAVNNPVCGLWKIDEYGNFHEPDEKKDFEYVCIGSGEEEVDGYIERQLSDELIDREKIDIPSAIDIAVGALDAAERDADTGLGVDFGVMTKKSVDIYGREIKKAMVDARRSKINQIKLRYSESIDGKGDEK
jgi:20S proteasome alpha/beta subunit